MKDYLYAEPDPTLSQMRWLVLIIWAVTFAILLGMFVKSSEILKPIVYPLNGGIFNSEYVPSQIP